MYYSKKTGGFYSRELHGDNIPEDAVEITAEKHMELINGQSSGKVIVSDSKGRPVLQELKISEEETREEANRLARHYLSSTDWYIIRKQETGEAIPEEILQERSAARMRVTP